MTKLLDILLEDRYKKYKKKETIKKTYHTYSCDFVVKFLKRVNRTQATERIRGIKTVTIVQTLTDLNLEKFNATSVEYDFELVRIKFVTNRDPNTHIKFIQKALIKSDPENGIDNIIGIVGASPRIDTLKKVD